MQETTKYFCENNQGCFPFVFNQMKLFNSYWLEKIRNLFYSKRDNRYLIAAKRDVMFNSLTYPVIGNFFIRKNFYILFLGRK